MKVEELIVEMGWIPLRRYCEITGQNPSTLHMRRVNGVWQEGVQIATPAGSGTYVNIHAIKAWCEAAGKEVQDVPALAAEFIRSERSGRLK